ncbi:MAG: AAA family ATPase [Verrucomicrobiaceae bacterium]|nr:AAA family ATPase [Verrucomicrobiaceae bacterium]
MPISSNPIDTQPMQAFAKQRGLMPNDEPKPSSHPASEGVPRITPQSLASCLITARDLATMQIPKRPRLLDKWLCEGDLGYVFAPRGVGKTWLAMTLPRAISQGASLGLWEAGESKTRVLYVDGEMPLELTQYRSRGIELGEGDVTYLHHEALFDHLGSSLNIGSEEQRTAITALLVEQGFKCVILDNLSSLASGVEENRGEHYEPIAHWLLELRRRKITVIIIHHAGRNAEVMRGHTKREDACSWIIQLRDAKQEGEPGAKFVSHFAKPSRNTGEPLRDLLWHFTTGKDGSVSIHCEVAEVSEYEAFIQHVLDGADTQADIAEMMGKPKGTISKWASKAQRDGRICRDGNKLKPPATPKKSHHETDDD